MGNSLGDYRIEKSSSSNLNNISWTQKNLIDTKKSKKKKIDKNFQNLASNIIYTTKTKKVEPVIEKVFKIENTIDKSKKEKIDKRFKHSSASNCNIQPGFKRPGR